MPDFKNTLTQNGTAVSLAGHTHTFASITSKPTTLAGYGITNAPTTTGAGASGQWDIDIMGTAAIASYAYQAASADYASTTPWSGVTSKPTTLVGYGITISAWTAPALTNGWANYGGAFNVAGYWEDPFGVVHLRGVIKSGTVGSAAFTLPSGSRPTGQELLVAISNGALGYIQITTAGAVIPTAPSSNTWVSLDGITFRT